MRQPPGSFSIFFKDMSQHDDCTDSQDQFCSALGIGQSVKWKQIVQDKKRRDLQNDLTHYRKTQRIFSKPQSLENTYSKEIYAKEDQSQAKSLEKLSAVSHDSVVIHKKTDQCVCTEMIQA